MTMSQRVSRYVRWTRERGAGWTALSVAASAAARISRAADDRLLALERRRMITGPGTRSSRGNSVEQNRAMWDAWDWSQDGEEWTGHARQRGLDPEQWRSMLVEEALWPNVPAGGVVLEIGPGAARWSRLIQPRASRLILGDISSTCLALCRERLAGADNVDYHLLPGDGSLPLDDETVDAIWSYDVFVHINPTDTANYLREFARVLRPGGRAVIHHSDKWQRDDGFRSHMDGQVFAGLAARAGLDVVQQRADLVHKEGDVLSVVAKPG